jgi:hypothetical protein
VLKTIRLKPVRLKLVDGIKSSARTDSPAQTSTSMVLAVAVVADGQLQWRP